MSLSIETARGMIHTWQCDHMGHANLRAYGELFEQALWHVFAHIGLTPEILRSGVVHMAGIQQNITYRKELYPGDCVDVRSALVDVQERRITMRHELLNTVTGEVCATCELTAVCIDPSTRRPRDLPPEIAAKAAVMLGGTSGS